jgi:hypothetical protein
MGQARRGLDPQRFNGLYAEPGFHYGSNPSSFLASQRHWFSAGQRALMPGDGEGRNGVWLARQGLAVTSFDPSVVGVDKARRLAAEHGVEIDAHVSAAEEWVWTTDCYDLVGLFFIHFGPSMRPVIHARALAAVKPGGLVLLEAFSPRQLAQRKLGAQGGPTELSRLFTCEMLRDDFAGARFDMLEETVEDFSGDGAFSGSCGVVRMVAERVA